MITLSIKDGNVVSPLFVIHAGSASDDVVRTDILDLISNAPNAIISGEPTNPTLIYFENFDYKAILNAQDAFFTRFDGRRVLAAHSRRRTLKSSDLLLRTSAGKLLVNSSGRFIRINRQMS